ncbi:iron ABC transporter permease [Hyphomicrobium sp. CS1GBMeth3]|uniref:FecCD family ABC transporter permease n=1 Tax=Hyphomicrobium sp. CS1GBMeth3 TaxID=1892845 RepID=UPI0009311E63|nr:iron ABC transporter permease [Hyphomicrobium sp. CS1GBMeth3]
MQKALSDRNAAKPLDRETIGRRLVVASILALSVAVVLSLSIGATGITLIALWRVVEASLFGTTDPQLLTEQLVLFGIRLPRTLLGAFVGAALGVSGAMMQGLFRNPLADPGIVGVSSGAALAAVATIALGNGLALPWVQMFGVYALPFAAFFGGFLTTTLLVLIAGRRGELMIGALLLSGIAIGAIAGALTGLISYASDDRELRDLTLWSLGSISGASWPKVIAILPFAAVIVVVLPFVIRALNGFLLGEAEAYHLGVDVERTKWLLILSTAASVGAAVAVAGIVGFVGIVVPHFVRLIAGPDHRFVLPCSALLGATLLLLADVIARMVVRPAELPLGIVMAAIGAPIFLHIVLRRSIGGLE